MNEMVKEILLINFLRKNGYSLIEITGNDGIIHTYAKKVNGVKKVVIRNKTYVINNAKRHTKGGMQVFRFYVNKSCGTGLDGKTSQTGKSVTTGGDMDSDILTEMIDYAAMLGEKTVIGDKKGQIIFLIMGAVIGLLLGMMLSGMDFAALSGSFM
jgi:hypothetical protein